MENTWIFQRERSLEGRATIKRFNVLMEICLKGVLCYLLSFQTSCAEKIISAMKSTANKTASLTLIYTEFSEIFRNTIAETCV